MVHHFAVHVSSRNREIFPESFSELSHICVYTDVNRYPKGTMPWHWHDAFQIDYVYEGSMEFCTSEEKVVLGQGDVLFVNPGVLHTTRSLDRQGCIYCSHIFTKEFLSGIYNSILDSKYILPIRESNMQIYAFSPDSPRRIQMASAVTQALKLCRDEPFGYEFDLRSELCSFWKDLFLETESLRSGAERRSIVDEERIKLMMAYIQDNFAQRLALDDIAEAAGISSRECTRCFNRCLGMTPIQYVTRYRLRVAADLLLQTGDSILAISEACGFSSAGYFSRTFSEYLGCTPKQYRDSGGVIML